MTFHSRRRITKIVESICIVSPVAHIYWTYPRPNAYMISVILHTLHGQIIVYVLLVHHVGIKAIGQPKHFCTIYKFIFIYSFIYYFFFFGGGGGGGRG